MNTKLWRSIGVIIVLMVIGGCVGYHGSNRNYQGHGYPAQGQYGNYGYGNYQGYRQPYRGHDNDDWNRGGYNGGKGGNGQHRDND